MAHNLIQRASLCRRHLEYFREKVQQFELVAAGQRFAVCPARQRAFVDFVTSPAKFPFQIPKDKQLFSNRALKKSANDKSGTMIPLSMMTESNDV
jgi:hypothetical protein